jgi:hypothetical protein
MVRFARVCKALIVVLVGMVVLGTTAAPALAVDGPVSGAERTTAGIAGNVQWFSWNRGDKRVRLSNTTHANMSNAHCVDAFFDWRTSGGHYDARILRNCKRGSYVQTDPASAGGDGYWSEDWGPRSITAVRVVVGYVIDDGTLNRLSGAGNTEVVYGSPPANADIPATQGQRYARVRTLYQDGHRETTADNAAKYHCAEGNIPLTDQCNPF